MLKKVSQIRNEFLTFLSFKNNPNKNCLGNFSMFVSFLHVETGNIFFFCKLQTAVGGKGSTAAAAVATATAMTAAVAPTTSPMTEMHSAELGKRYLTWRLRLNQESPVVILAADSRILERARERASARRADGRTGGRADGPTDGLACAQAERQALQSQLANFWQWRLCLCLQGFLTLNFQTIFISSSQKDISFVLDVTEVCLKVRIFVFLSQRAPPQLAKKATAAAAPARLRAVDDNDAAAKTQKKSALGSATLGELRDERMEEGRHCDWAVHPAVALWDELVWDSLQKYANFI